MLDRLERIFLKANKAVIALLLAAMAVLVFANVVCRYLLGFSFGWVEELTRYMMIWLGFLGAGLALRGGGHIALDVFQDLLPPRGAQLVRVLVVLTVAGFLAAITWIGIEYASFGWYQETPVLNLSFGMVYLAIPIGCALMLVHLALILRGYVASRTYASDADIDPTQSAL